jgi:hypothetical protein
MPNNLGFAGSLKVEEIFHSNSPPPPPPSPLLSSHYPRQLLKLVSYQWLIFIKLAPRWDIGLKAEVKGKDCVKVKTFIERSRHFGPLNPEWGGGGPHVCIKFVKEDCVGIIYGNVSYKVRRNYYLSAPIHIFYIFFMCEEISFKFSANQWV